MDRAIPEFNKLVARREHLVNRFHHKHNIRSAAKIVDNNLPFSYVHPVNRKSKEAAQEGKCTGVVMRPVQKGVPKLRRTTRNCSFE